MYRSLLVNRSNDKRKFPFDDLLYCAVWGPKKRLSNALQRHRVVYGKQRELQPRRNACLVEGISNVVLHGVFTDIQVFGNLFVGETSYYRRDHFQFPRRETEFLSTGFLSRGLH